MDITTIFVLFVVRGRGGGLSSSGIEAPRHFNFSFYHCGVAL